MDTTPLKKRAYFKTLLPKKWKVCALLAIIPALLCAALLYFSYEAAVETSVEKIPVLHTVEDFLADGDEPVTLAGVKADLAKQVQEYAVAFRLAQLLLPAEERAAVSELVEAAEEAGQTLSLRRVETVLDKAFAIDAMDPSFESLLGERYPLILGYCRQGERIAGIIHLSLVIWAAVASALTLLAALFRSRVLGILGFFFAFSFALFFAPLYFAAAVALLHLALFLLLHVRHRAYRKYRKGLARG